MGVIVGCFIELGQLNVDASCSIVRKLDPRSLKVYPSPKKLLLNWFQHLFLNGLNKAVVVK